MAEQDDERGWEGLHQAADVAAEKNAGSELARRLIANGVDETTIGGSNALPIEVARAYIVELEDRLERHEMSARMRKRLGGTSTYTYAILEVTPALYQEVRAKLVEADYGGAFHTDDGREVIDMHGIALAAALPAPTDKCAFCNHERSSHTPQCNEDVERLLCMCGVFR